MKWSRDVPGRGMNVYPHAPERFEFVPLREEHLPMLHGWLARPHVAAWWQPTPSIEDLRRDYVAEGYGPHDTRAYIAFYERVAIGFIQCYLVVGSGGGWWQDETDPGARGIDQFLCDPQSLGRGLGSAMVRAFVDRLFEDPSITVVQTDPAVGNERAIRSYARAGFAVERRVETPDGPATLMRRHRADARQGGAASAMSD